MKFFGGFLWFTVVVYFCFVCFPVTCSQVYHQYVFQSFRVLYDLTFGNLPFPSVYLVCGIILILVIFFTKRRIKKVKEKETFVPFKKLIIKATLSVLFIVSLFYWVWGFHYFQPNLKSRWNLSYTEIDSSYLNQQIERLIPLMLKHRQVTSVEEIVALSHHDFLSMEDDLRVELVRILDQSGWQTLGKVRVRSIGPEGVLLRLSTAGIYFPFVFEGHVDKGLHPLQLPFTLAHEMAHGYGVTDEGDCNTLAFLACIHSEKSVYIYASLLTYFKYLYYDPRNSEFVKNRIFQTLPEIIRQDLVDIRNQSNKFPDLFPQIRDFFYESYLLLMGVEDGLQSYHSLVDKVRSIHDQKQGVLPAWFSSDPED